MARPLHGTTVGGSLAKLAQHYEVGEKGNEVIQALGKRRRAFTPGELATYGNYCKNDVELTYKIFRHMVDGFPKNELKLIDLTLKMFTEPVLELDKLKLEQHLAYVKDEKEELLRKAGILPQYAQHMLMSNERIANLLSSYGVDIPYKISPATNKMTYAFAKTDPGMKLLLEHELPVVQAIVAARLGVKTTLEETRTQRFINIADRGKLPVPLSYCAAHTGRWGGTDKINFQNLPSRGANAGKLKSAIMAPPGHVIIDSDSSQIEARMLAWMAGQNDLVEAFRNNDAEKRAGVPEAEQKWDVYKIRASEIYNKPVGEITKPERFVGKSTILGSGYGMGPRKFQDTMKMFGVEMNVDMANHIIYTYRRKYSLVPCLWDVGNMCLRGLVENRSCEYGLPKIVKVAWGMVHTPMGLPLRYPGVRRTKSAKGEESYAYESRTGITHIWGGKFTENIIQHLARLVIGEQMIRIAKRYRVVMTVHDAIGCVVPEEQKDEALAYIEECMRWVPSWAEGLPLNCEAGVGATYGEC
jgi:DNA polymerase